MAKKMIAVIGAGSADGSIMKIAEEVGRLIAKGGAVMVCGGLGGVMEAAARGAQSAGGLTVGILPQARKQDANPHIDIAIPTGFGEGRNVVIARTADVLIAVAGEYGTLSEIAFGLRMGKPVIGIGTWDIKGVIKAETAEKAVRRAFEVLKQ
ncbi:MAG TPA: TIGR00725 family protein [Nitrospiraceae bacterium]|nr:TIGR00725 family protein [Nitrospiraceae bacterium]